MAFFTYNIKNEQYPAYTALRMLSNYNSVKETAFEIVKLSIAVVPWAINPLLGLGTICLYLGISSMSAPTYKINYNNFNYYDFNYNNFVSGVELTNALNDLSDCWLLSPYYYSNKADVMDKLLYHLYAGETPITLDDKSIFSWPGAVLNAHKEDLSAHKSTLANMQDNLQLVQEPSAELSGNNVTINE